MRTKWMQDAALQWRQNQRLRYAVLLAVVVLAMHGILKLADRRDQIAKEWARDQELIARLKSVSSEPDWIRRGAVMQQRLRDTVLSMPEAATMGQAKADQAVWLAELGERAKLADPQVKVEDALVVPKYPGLLQVVARLESQAIAPWDLGKPLRDFGRALPWRQVERAEFSASNPTRFSVIVRSYYRMPEFKPPAVPAPLPSTQAKDALDGAMPRTAAVPSATSAAPAAASAPARPQATPAPQVDGKSAKTGVLRQVLDKSEPTDAAASRKRD